MGIENGNGHYLRLPHCDETQCDLAQSELELQDQKRWNRIWWWVKAALACLFLVGAAAVLLLFGGPLVVNKVILPVIHWEEATFTRPVLAIVLFTCIALFPSVLLPSSPCMWIAGMTFGYGYGFLLITGAISIGMSLPFFIGSLFHQRLHIWLERWPKKAAIVRLAGEGDWFHQFRAVVLLRVSPFPYIIFNYASVATNVKYGPYFAGSMVGTLHETFITIYSGKLIYSLAEATNQGSFLTMDQIIYNVVGFTIAATSTAAITIYAKKALQHLQLEDELI
ncbi:hypothetical protein LUZ63_011471 [Rhynchospora breviuscula]|uniref:VTT domain-containing protein n=1 Tax=Rhynchospora breviuscula TaxID=2022672 RepID=A0A9Q0CJ44_9POAL|nr:hypothetical protein LUZ63_011471 [Rhynchospora breviuscula]